MGGKGSQECRTLSQKKNQGRNKVIKKKKPKGKKGTFH